MKRLFCLFLLLAACLPAQDTTANVTGVVSDPSGAVVVEAKVTIVNTQTGVRTDTVSNAQGVYNLPFLIPGSYELRVSAGGFRGYLRQGLVLETGQNLRLDVNLVVGDVAETVSVTGAAMLLETESAAASQLIENKTVIDMPMASRRAASLVRLLGGVTYIQETAAEQAPMFSMAGGRSASPIWSIDGGIVTNVAQGAGWIEGNPPMEALQEIRVEANNYSAEYGHSNGGVISMTTRSGTNEFRGVLYEDLRNSSLSARSFFSPGVPPRHYNVFGGTFGGPIRKDRTHFFFAYEGARRRDGITRILGVPTPAEVSGDFSARTGTLLDPTTRTPFPNNVIPANRLDPVGAALAALYPAPNVPGRASGNNNFIANTMNSATQDTILARIDHVLTGKDRISGRYMYIRSDSTAGAVFPVAGADPFGNHFHYPLTTLTADWLRTLSPSLIVDVRYTFGTRTNYNYTSGYGSNLVQKVGLQGVPSDGMPLVTTTGLAALGGTSQYRLQSPIGTQQVISSVSKYHNKHALKAGLDWWRSANRDVVGGTRYGSLSFNDVATGTGFGLAALLLGWNQAASVSSTLPIDTRVTYYGVYLQDDWKITTRLTLNLGLRWDVDRPMYETHNRRSGFDPFAINPVSGTPGAMLFAGINGVTSYAHNTDWNNVGPRFGFAWRPWGDKTVVRGGFGVIYGAEYATAVTTVGAAGFGDARAFSSPDNGLTPALLLKNGIPQVPPAALGPGFGAVPVGQPVQLAPNFIAPDHVNPYSLMSHFAVQRQLPGNAMVELSGQSNLSHKVGDVSGPNINETVPALRGATANQSLRPFPQYGNISSASLSWGNASYYAFNVKVEKRFSQGLNLLVNYTWSKFLQDVTAGQELGGPLQGGSHQSYYARHIDKGLSGNDIPQRLSVSTVYELPFGVGRHFLNRRGFLNQVVGGWELGVIAEVHSGPAFGVVEQTNRLNSFSPSQRPNELRSAILPGGRSRADEVVQYFDTSVFTSPGNGVLGNSGVTVAHAPGLANVDMSLLKHWKIGEKRTVQLRGEFFNLFNRANFGVPNNLHGSPAFGSITGTFNDGRVIQLGLRLSF
jgi:hypothetical protein